jgi:O-antigen/teichoic acid export membrane protein
VSGARSGIARATIAGFIAEALVFPVGLITAAFLTRNLGVAQYGRLSLIYAVVSPVVWLASTTFAGRIAVTLLTEARDWRPMAAALLRANLLLGLGAMIGFAATTPWLAAGLGAPELAPVLSIAAVEILLAPVIRIHRDALIAEGRYSWPAVASGAYQLARVTLVLVLVAAGWALVGVVAANLGARAVELVVCRVRIRVPVRGAARGWFAPLLTRMGALFGYTICLQLFSRLDLLMLGFLGAMAPDLGHYGAAQNLALAPALLAMVLGPLIVAAIRRAELGGYSEEAAALKSGSLRLALATWALAGPVAAGGSRLAVLLFGPAFVPTGPLLGWLGVAAGAGLMLSVASAHQIAAGRFGRPLVAGIPLLVVAAALQLAWIPRHGALGAAWATTIAAILAVVIAMGYDGLRGLPARMFGLVRMAGAGAAGYLATGAAARVGMPSPVDIMAGAAVTGISLLVVRLTSAAELRLLAREFTGTAAKRQAT